jgi:hypothetical protein
VKASQKPGTEAKLVKLLEGLDRLCTEWINAERAGSPRRRGKPPAPPGSRP